MAYTGQLPERDTIRRSETEIWGRAIWINLLQRIQSMFIFVLHIIAHHKVTTAPRTCTKCPWVAMAARMKAMHGSTAPIIVWGAFYQGYYWMLSLPRTESDAELSVQHYLLRRQASHLLADGFIRLLLSKILLLKLMSTPDKGLPSWPTVPTTLPCKGLRNT